MIVSLAWKNIWRKPVRSLIVVISVILGLWVTVFLFGYIFGIIDQRFKDAINKEISHIQIHHPEFKEDYEAQYFIKDADSIKSTLQNNNKIEAFAKRSIAQGMIASANNSMGGMFVGIQPEQEQKVTQLFKAVSEGKNLTSNDKNKIVIGKRLAEKLKVKLRSKVVLTFSDKKQNIVSAAFKIVGFYTSNNSVLEEGVSYILKSDLNRLLSIDNNVHEIAILLKSKEDVDQLASELQNTYQQSLTERWVELSPELGLMINSLDEYMMVFLVIILLALCFGIINTMLMSVLERVRELGILMAIGLNNTKIFLMIIIETLMIIGLAAPIGMSLAYLTIAYFQANGLDMSGVYGEAYGSFGISNIIYPQLSGMYYFRIFIMVSIAALLSAIYPAWTAIRLDPITAIRKI